MIKSILQESIDTVKKEENVLHLNFGIQDNELDSEYGLRALEALNDDIQCLGRINDIVNHHDFDLDSEEAEESFRVLANMLNSSKEYLEDDEPLCLAPGLESALGDLLKETKDAGKSLASDTARKAILFVGETLFVGTLKAIKELIVRLIKYLYSFVKKFTKFIAAMADKKKRNYYLIVAKNGVALSNFKRKMGSDAPSLKATENAISMNNAMRKRVSKLAEKGDYVRAMQEAIEDTLRTYNFFKMNTTEKEREELNKEQTEKLLNDVDLYNKDSLNTAFAEIDKPNSMVSSYISYISALSSLNIDTQKAMSEDNIKRVRELFNRFLDEIVPLNIVNNGLNSFGFVGKYNLSVKNNDIYIEEDGKPKKTNHYIPTLVSAPSTYKRYNAGLLEVDKYYDFARAKLDSASSTMETLQRLIADFMGFNNDLIRLGRAEQELLAMRIGQASYDSTNNSVDSQLIKQMILKSMTLGSRIQTDLAKLNEGINLMLTIAVTYPVRY